VKKIAQFAKEKAGAMAGIQPVRPLETIGDVNNPAAGILQRDPVSGEIKQVTAPVKDDHFDEAEAGRMERARMAREAAERRQRESDGVRDQRTGQSLRKEFNSLPNVKAYKEVLPLVESAKKAPDTGYGDLQLIYTVGKVLDPGSVVREGELSLVIKSGSVMENILGTTRLQLAGKGRISPDMRRKMVEMLNERVNAYGQAYKSEFDQYSEYAKEAGFDPEMIVGKPAASAFQQPNQPRTFQHQSGATIEIIE